MEGFKKKLYGVCSNENREAVLYEHFAGDNSSLKSTTKLKKYIYSTFYS